MPKKNLCIADIGEQAFIRSIMDNCHFCRDDLIKGIGDDCAVIGPYGGKVLLVTTDILLEDIHFIRGNISAEALGQKAVAVNLSDIAAMGGEARFILISIAIPGATKMEFLKAVYVGVKAMCRRYRVSILGGDTSASTKGIMISVTAIGEAPALEVLFRSGAKHGDHLFVVGGSLGASAAGLRVLKGELSAPERLASRLISAHNLPVPLLEAGRIIARSRMASAMIDLSDGILSDLRHICEASGVGALLFQDLLPISPDLKDLADINNFNPYDLALGGGEDYGLLVSVPGKKEKALQALFKNGTPSPIHRVGAVTEALGIRLLTSDGAELPLEGTGFDHFAV